MPSKILDADDFEVVRWAAPSTPETFTNSAGEEVTISVLENEYTDSTRWEEIWRVVWHEFQGNTYAYYYRKPATEYQESDDEFYPRDIFEVVAEQVTVIKYKKKTNAS